MARVLRRAAHLSLYEFFGLYAPKAYVAAWIPRVILEALFFALVAQFIGGHELLLFALVGLTAYRTLQSTLTFTTASVTWELYAGTLPLLVGSPTSPLLVLTGRNLAWMANGLITGLLTLAVAAVLGLALTPFSLLGALVVLMIIELSSYALGVFVGSVILRFPGFGNLTATRLGFVLFAISGVNIPLSALPDWVQTIALGAPLAHGLLALREVLGAADPSVFVPLLAAEIGIGATYFGLAMLSFALFLHRARLHGTLDYH
jgi:ABC-2 type transport system permease protein